MKSWCLKGLSVMRDFCLILGITITLLAGLELSARVYVRIRTLFAAQQPPPMYKWRPSLALQPWGPQYAADLKDGLRKTFKPYVDGREAPFQSETVIIDSDGLRVNPFSSNDSQAQRIFMFGGSTMLGDGVPDWGTVPAYIAKKLNARKGGRQAKVVNFGSNWWTSSQSVAQLIVLLRHGERPEKVIFLDGINDIDVITHGGPPGGIDPELTSRLNDFMSGDKDKFSLKAAIFNHVSVLSLLANRDWVKNILRGKSNTSRQKQGAQVSRVKIQDAATDTRLAAEIARYYAENIRIVHTLAKEYRFKAYFFLQPFPLIVDKPLLDWEQALFLPRRNSWEVKFITLAYEKLRALKSVPNFFDLSHLFDGTLEDVFVDFEHLSPRGNDLLADQILLKIGGA